MALESYAMREVTKLPVYRNHIVFEIVRGIKAFLRLKAGLTRGTPGSTDTRDREAKDPVDLLKNGLATQPESVKAAVRNLRREVKAAEASKESAKSFRTLEGETGLKVHLGCGEDVREGWVNIDLAPILPRRVDPAAHANATFIDHDLRRGLPLEDGSCDFIYSSHFFEHLEYEHGLRLMHDCYRTLRPGGVFRIVLPNLRGFFEAYLRGEKEYFDELDPFIYAYMPSVIESGTKTLIDYINFGVYQNGEHKYIYDEEKLDLILEKIGYTSVVPSSYQEGIDLDVSFRQRYSFYMEAVK